MQSIAELRYKLGNLKMSADQNPSILFCQLATLEHAYVHTRGRTTDDNMIGTIFAVAPEKYWSLLNLVAENKGANLIPRNIEMAMSKIWCQNGGNKGISTQAAAKKNTEIMLNAFMGICYVFKEKVHRALDCPAKELKVSKSNKAGKQSFNGKFNHCDKAGQQKVDCWELPENAAKKPSSYKGNSEHANVHVDNNSRSEDIEYVLCTIEAEAKKDCERDVIDLSEQAKDDLMFYGDVVVVNNELKEEDVGLVDLTFPDTVKLLEYPCIWIGNTATTIHMTPHVAGMVPNNGNKLKGQSIMVGNGKTEVNRMHGSINGQMIDKKGIAVGRATLTDVVYSPSMKFHLCSLSRLMENGWKMSGNDNGIKMSKNGKGLMFDTVVRTVNGVVYCLYLKHMSNKLGLSPHNCG